MVCAADRLRVPCDSPRQYMDELDTHGLELRRAPGAAWVRACSKIGYAAQSWRVCACSYTRRWNETVDTLERRHLDAHTTRSVQACSSPAPQSQASSRAIRLRAGQTSNRCAPMRIMGFLQIQISIVNG